MYKQRSWHQRLQVGYFLLNIFYPLNLCKYVDGVILLMYVFIYIFKSDIVGNSYLRFTVPVCKYMLMIHNSFKHHIVSSILQTRDS